MSNWVVGDGAHIGISFSKPLVGDVSGNAPYFTVTVPEYTFVPGGEIILAEKSVAAVSRHPTIADAILLEMEPLERFKSAAGSITVSYAGGTLQGEDDAVTAFSLTFAPVGLIAKPNVNGPEHVEISDFTATGTLTQIQRHYFKADDEHIGIADIVPVGRLIHIDDI